MDSGDEGQGIDPGDRDGEASPSEDIRDDRSAWETPALRSGPLSLGDIPPQIARHEALLDSGGAGKSPSQPRIPPQEAVEHDQSEGVIEGCLPLHISA